MYGRGRWLGNMFIERLWRSLLVCVYLNAFETGSEVRRALADGAFLQPTSASQQPQRVKPLTATMNRTQ